MKKNSKLESIRKRIPADVKAGIDHSFALIDRIDKIMIQKGITQKELAAKLGKSESEISKWMRGTHNFTFRTVAKLELALATSLLQISKGNPSVFVMTVKNGPSVTNCAVEGIKQNSDGSGTIYRANESKTTPLDLMMQLN